MTVAVGLVMTEHIVAGRLEDHKLVGNTIRYPAEDELADELGSIPSGDLLEILATQVATLAAEGGQKLDAIGVAVPGVVRHNIIEDSPNLQQIKGLHMGEELSPAVASARHLRARAHCQRC